MRFIRFLLALGLVGLVVAGVYLLGDERRATGGDGTGYRLALGSPSAMQPGVCPDYRDNAGAKYFWDRHAFTEVLEAQLSHCGRIDTGPLGEWVVEERNDSRGGYSISAHLDARNHTVTFDWGRIRPEPFSELLARRQRGGAPGGPGREPDGWNVSGCVVVALRTSAALLR